MPEKLYVLCGRMVVGVGGGRMRNWNKSGTGIGESDGTVSIGNDRDERAYGGY